MFYPPITRILDILIDPKSCIDFLLANEIIYEALQCPRCSSQMIRENSRFRCPKQSCRAERSLFHESFFAGEKLKPNEILHIGYYFITKTPFELACGFTGHSTKTISAYYAHYRQLIIESLEEDDDIIGGQGIIVELDESKFGKRKYNRGHRVEGCWVLGGVERTEERKLFACVVPDRKSKTLLNAIKKHVKEGSVILSDLWKGYEQINQELGFEHFKVNHSKHFKDPETGIHTNTIEGTWNGMKMSIAPRSRTIHFMGDRLLEFIWRRKNSNNLWEALIEALKSIKYI